MDIYKTLNKIKTHLITFGEPFECSEPEVIVVIPGSPGIPEFYREFASELYNRTELPVCVVGHAGHDAVEISSEDPSLFTVEGQIKHKLDLIINHIDKKTKVHVIGHSVGAWLLTELLHKNDYILERILSVNLLFPTLQNFSDTINGRRVNNFVRRFHKIVLFLFFLTQIAPFIRLFIIKIYLILNSLPLYYVDRILVYLRHEIQEKSMLLAYESLDRIKELNENAINKVKHITNVVYSRRDGWVPMQHLDDLKRVAPQIKLREINVDHVFVLKSSIVVGNVVADLIISNHTSKKIK